MKLIAECNKEQTLLPLILVHLVGTLLEYWHFQYHEYAPNAAALSEDLRLQNYRKFIFEKLV